MKSNTREAGRDVEIKLLRAFLGVASEQSFTGAAQLIGCSQGAISTRVRALEDHLGVRLFHRARLNVRLTSAGRDLLPGVRELLVQYGNLFRDARARTVSGPVRIGAVEGFGAALLAPLLEHVRERYPAIELEVACNFEAGLRQAVEAGSLDLALLVLEDEAPSETTLDRPRLQWVGVADFAFSEDDPVPVAGYPEGCPIRAVVLTALEDRGIAYRVVLTSWSESVLDRVLRSGSAIAAMPENLVPEGLKVLNRPSLLPRLGRASVQLLERPGLHDEAANAVGRQIADIYRGL